MWMIDPKLLCKSHLLGEHGELHKHRHNFVKKHSMNGRLGQIEPKSMLIRHDELAQEILRRGYNHNSPYEMPNIDYLPDELKLSEVDRSLSYRYLCARCEECRQNITK